MHAVLVANPKGGCGKTTLSVNLAGMLARRGRRTLLLDLDRQRSSLEWLALRSAELPRIEQLKDIDVEKERRRGEAWMIIDTPAGLQGKNLGHAIKPSEKVIVPIQPSLFDMAAAQDFLTVLSEEKAVRKQKTFIGIVGMRVDERTRAAFALETFLRQFDLPVVAFLRDSVVYANAALEGKSIFDLPPSLVDRDMRQWQPLIDWIES